ncbi:MAG: hypothetical protein V3T07_02305 [Myxococcota bacterium]
MRFEEPRTWRIPGTGWRILALVLGVIIVLRALDVGWLYAVVLGGGAGVIAGNLLEYKARKTNQEEGE